MAGKTLYHLFIAALSLVLLAGCVVVEPSGRSKQGRSDKAFICHKGKKTIHAGGPSLDAHLGHGDYIGACR